MPTYTASYLWTVEQFVRGSLHHFKSQTEMRPVILWAWNGLLVFVALISLLMLMIPRANGSPAFSLLFLCVVGCWIFRVPISIWWWKQKFERSSHQGLEMQWTFSSELVTQRAGDGTYIELPWSRFVKVLEVSDGFLLYFNKSTSYWVPFEAFTEPEGVVAVRDFIEVQEIPLVYPSR